MGEEFVDDSTATGGGGCDLSEGTPDCEACSGRRGYVLDRAL